MLALVAGPAGASGGPVPAIQLTPKYALKWAAALTLFGAGMHYLVQGRKDADFGKMMTGAVLALASLAFLV